MKLMTASGAVLYEGRASSFAELTLQAMNENCDLRNTDFSNCDLSHITLDGMDLSGCHFNNTNLTGANLSECRFDQARFKSTLLYDACFCESEFKDTHFIDCHFAESNFAHAKLSHCIFSSSHFMDINLHHAELHNVLYRYRNTLVKMTHAPLILKTAHGNILHLDDVSFCNNKQMSDAKHEAIRNMLQELYFT